MATNDKLKEENELLEEQQGIQAKLKQGFTEIRNLHREISRQVLTQVNRLEKEISGFRQVHSILKAVNRVGQTHVAQVETVAKMIGKKFNVGNIVEGFTKQLHSAVKELIDVQKILTGALVIQTASQSKLFSKNGTTNGNGHGNGSIMKDIHQALKSEGLKGLDDLKASQIAKTGKLWDKAMFTPFERVKRWFADFKKELKKPIQLELAGIGGGGKGGGGLTTLMGGFFGNFKHLATPANALWVILGKVLLTFRSLDRAAWDFRRTMGLTRDSSAAIQATTQQLAAEFMGLGVSVEKLYDDAVAFVSSFGSLKFITRDVQRNIALMSAQLGVSDTVSASFLKRISAIKGTTAGAQTDMLGFTAALSEAAGTNLGEIMKDVASASEDALKFTRGNFLQLIQSAVKARQLGTTINDIARSSRGLLDFTSSIESEMEASVLTGQSINLQLARQLAYHGDLIGSNQEILRLAKQINFNQLDPFQMEAFSKAAGKSVVEIQNMLQSQKQIAELELRSKADQSLSKRLSKYKELSTAAEGLANIEGKNYEKQLLMKANQDRLTILANKWEQVWVKLVDVAFPFVDSLLSVAPFFVDAIHQGLRLTGVFLALSKAASLFKATVESIKNTANVISGRFARVGQVLEPLEKSFARVKSIFSTAANFIGKAFFKLGVGVGKVAGWIKGLTWIQKAVLFVKELAAALKPVVGWFGELFSPLTKALPFLGTITKLFGKWIPVIGWVITGLTVLGSLFKRFREIELVKGDWIGNIWKGIKAVGGALYDAIIQPFVDVWTWLKKTFLGNSPSQLGLSILDGISSVGGMVYDAILSPFTNAWKWITEKFSSIGSLLGFGGNAKIEIPIPSLSPAIQQQATTEIATDRELKPPAVSNQGLQRPKESISNIQDQTLLREISGKLDTLIKTLQEKDFAVNMDSQLVSINMRRSNHFRGNYGAVDK